MSMDQAKSLCARDKNWDELSDSEKIERMRMEVKNLQSKCERLERAIVGLRQHQHGADGGILVPYNPHGSQCESESPARNRATYF